MAYSNLISDLTITLYNGTETQPFYKRKFNWKEITDQLKKKNSKLMDLHKNPVRFMQTHSCTEGGVDFDDHGYKGLPLGTCSSYFSQYSQQNPPFDDVLTFVYTDRDFVWKTSGKPRQIRLHASYTFDATVSYSGSHSFQRYYTIRNQAQPVIRIPKIIGICSREHRIIEAKLHFPDPTFSDRAAIQLLWYRVVEESQTNKESVEPISTRLRGANLGTYLSRLSLFPYPASTRHIFMYI